MITPPNPLYIPLAILAMWFIDIQLERNKMNIINIADLTDPDDERGRSYREVNNEKVHFYPKDTLVQLECGARLHVEEQTRDCDGTPLYTLSDRTEASSPSDYALYHGYAEDGFKAVVTVK
jgi:hypothetical protein